MEQHCQDVFDSAFAPPGTDIGPAVELPHLPLQGSGRREGKALFGLPAEGFRLSVLEVLGRLTEAVTL